MTQIPLPSLSPGTFRHLQVWRFGPENAPSAYLQGSLHADELPGMLVLHHLIRKLIGLESQLCKQVIVVPVANPIGLSNWVAGCHLGRYELNSLENFNRRYPDLGEAAFRILQHTPAQTNRDQAIQTVRAALQQALSEQPAPKSEVDHLRHHLMQLCLSSDIVLDLHCDFEACMHLYLGTPLWPAAQDLGAWLGAKAILTAECSGGNPFDEAVGGPWWSLAHRLPWVPADGCLSATVELRGMTDVSDAHAEQDASHLLGFLWGRGWLKGEAPEPPEPLCTATPLEGVEMIRVDGAGLLSWDTAPGSRVLAGQRIGWRIDPYSQERFPILSSIAGVLFGRVGHRLCTPGQIVAKVAGAEVIRSGYLLTD